MSGRWRFLTQNWPIKLAAVFFSVVLWLAVASEEPTTALLPVKVTVELPAGRMLTQPLPEVSALVAGSGREMLKLRTSQPEIRKLVPDTISTSVYTLALGAGDVVLPLGVKATVHDLQPREIQIALDEVAHRDVPIVARVSVRPESGFAVQGGLSISPSKARVVGLPNAVNRIDTVYTVPLEMVQVSAPFQRAVAIDTNSLDQIRITPRTVEISGVVTALSERAFPNVLIRAPGRASRTFVVEPDSVLITVRGPASRILALTRDSIRVAVELDGQPSEGARARVVVVPPPGVTGRATPETVTLKTRPPAPTPPRRRG
jgi:YbbR domain-containing protein